MGGKPRIFGKIGPLILLFGVLGGAVGCTRGGSGSLTQEKQRSVLKVQLSSEPISLDPAEVEDGSGLNLIAQLREGLVGYDDQGHLKNLLAESYSISRNGRRFEFKLRPDLRWSDGQLLQVQDFVFGIRRALSPEMHGRATQQLLVIRGAERLKRGEIPFDPRPSDRTVGVFEENGKLVIELERPAPYFIHALTLPAALPVRRDILAESGGRWSEDKAPGTGPYRFAAYQPGKRFLIEANPYYWQGTPPIQLIDFLFVNDESTALNLFETGKIDLLTRVPSMDLPRLRKLPEFRSNPFHATYFIAFNTRKSPFDRADFRRAVSGVIRRDEIVKALDSGEAPAFSWLPVGIDGYLPYRDPRIVFAPAIRKIRDSIAAHPPKVPFFAAFDTGSRNSMIMEKIQQDLRNGLGMKISLSNLDWKTYVKSLQTEAPTIYRFGWLTPFADPINPLEAFTTGNPNNYARWSNPAYDKLVREISEMPSGPKRDAKIERAQHILVDEEAAVVPIYHYVQTHLVQPRVHGFRVNPFGVISFREMSLKELAGGEANGR